MDEKVLDFIMRRWKASEINEIESSQLVVLALNHVAATESVMAKAQVRSWWTSQVSRASQRVSARQKATVATCFDLSHTDFAEDDTEPK